MKKVVISGSASLQDAIISWKRNFEDNDYQVIGYPKPWDNTRDFSGQFTELYTDFYKAIEQCDTFFLVNEDKNGISGYIGASGTAELVYAIMQNLLHGRNIEIYIAKMPDEKVFAYDEICKYLKMGWVNIYK